MTLVLAAQLTLQPEGRSNTKNAMVDKKDIYKIIISRRTIRAFKPKPIPLYKLKELVNAARLAPSAANLQPLEFIVVDDRKICNKIFPYLRWAAYIHPQGIPLPAKRPFAYIAVLVNPTLALKGGVNLNRTREEFFAYDMGAAVENILLAAWDEDIGSCWIHSLDRKPLQKILKIPSFLRLDSLVALGYCAEAPKIEQLKDSVKYWKDKRGVLHVPKRSLKEIIHHNKY